MGQARGKGQGHIGHPAHPLRADSATATLPEPIGLHASELSIGLQAPELSIGLHAPEYQCGIQYYIKNVSHFKRRERGEGREADTAWAVSRSTTRPRPDQRPRPDLGETNEGLTCKGMEGGGATSVLHRLHSTYAGAQVRAKLLLKIIQGHIGHLAHLFADSATATLTESIGLHAPELSIGSHAPEQLLIKHVRAPAEDLG